MSSTTDLSKFNNKHYYPGNPIARVFWYIINAIFFKSSMPFSSLKCGLLRVFGAKVGIGVIIKPNVNVKYPWKLTIGDHVWIGEEVWIDNLDQVTIGSNCCLSQGAMLLCGNHDYSKTTFDLITGSITLHDGVWIGAKAVVGPGVVCGPHSVLSVMSMTSKDLLPNTIYRGNPAIPVKTRTISA